MKPNYIQVEQVNTLHGIPFKDIIIQSREAYAKNGKPSVHSIVTESLGITYGWVVEDSGHYAIKYTLIKGRVVFARIIELPEDKKLYEFLREDDGVTGSGPLTDFKFEMNTDYD